MSIIKHWEIYIFVHIILLSIFIKINILDVSKSSNTNLLDNWYFIDPINQKGLTTYNKFGYTIDRWYSRYNLECSLTVGTGFTVPESFTLEQPTEYDLSHKTVTISVLHSSGLSKWTVNLGDTNSFAPGWSGPVNCVLFGGNTFSLRFYNGGILTYIAAKVEIGPQQTLAKRDSDGNWVLNDPPPNKAEMLAKCQRYFDIIQSRIHSNTTEVVYFHQHMRAIPTIYVQEPLGTISTYLSNSDSGYTTQDIAWINNTDPSYSRGGYIIADANL